MSEEPIINPGHVLIIGAGVAGVTAATTLRQQGHTGPITLVDSGPFPHDRPPLSKEYLSGAHGPEQITLHGPAWFVEHDITLVVGASVDRLRLDGPAVHLGDGTIIEADTVVLATGGRAARPALPGVDDPRVHVLRTVEDADRLRAALTPGTRLLVVGAALLGSEIAVTARQLGCDVTLVDPEPVPLADAVGERLATWLHEQHQHGGVTTRQVCVRGFVPGPSEIRAEFDDGTHADVDVAVIAVGLEPETRLAEAAGLRVDGGILVDAAQRASHPSVLAVGDCSRRVLDGESHFVAGHWDAAKNDAVRATATLLGQSPPAETRAWFWSDRHDLHLDVIGDWADAEQTLVRGTFGEPPFLMFGLRGDDLVAAAAVNDPRHARALRKFLDRDAQVDPQLLIDPEVDLRALLRR